MIYTIFLQPENRIVCISLFYRFCNLETVEKCRLRLDLYFSYELFAGNIYWVEVSCSYFHALTRGARKNPFYTEATHYASNTSIQYNYKNHKRIT
jgi:hypothetical protein